MQAGDDDLALCLSEEFRTVISPCGENCEFAVGECCDAPAAHHPHGAKTGWDRDAEKVFGENPKKQEKNG